MSIPRGLSDAEQAAWAKLASSVTPLAGRRPPPVGEGGHAKHGGGASSRKVQSATTAPPVKPPPKPVIAVRRPRPPLHQPAAGPAPRSGEAGLDSHWNRKLNAGQIAPDYTLDLHGHTLDHAYDRIISGIDQARSMGARVVLVIAGRDRGADPADRQHKRGAIRAKLLDWLAASQHADAIAAIRRAHQRHGGEGALYLVLRRGR